MVSTTNLTGSGTADSDVLKCFINNTNATDEKKNNFGSKNTISNRKREFPLGSSFRQITAAIIANLGTINTGLTMGFSTMAIPQLTKNKNGSIIITNEEASWVASLSPVGTQCGCILSACLTDSLGRKRTLLLTYLPAILGWIIIAVAPTIEWMYIGRILTGLSSGMVGAPSRVYTAEVTQPHLRGFLSGLASIGASFGVAFEYLIGSIYDWRTLAWISSFIPILSVCTTFLLPESPLWLVSSGQKHKCFNSLKKLRGSTCDVRHEVNILVEFSERHHSNATLTTKEKLRIIFQSSTLKPFFILITYFSIYQFSGSNPLIFYTVCILDDYRIKEENQYLLTVISGIMRLIFTVFGCILMFHIGRRPLTFVSTIGCGITMFILAIYGLLSENWKEKGTEPIALWIPILSIYLFVVVTSVGYLIVPWVMIGELYPTEVRGVVGGLTTALCYFFIFVAVKTYPILRNWLSVYGPFFIYGAISLLGTIFIYVYLPETKDKTLQEIEEYFSGNKQTKILIETKKKPIVIKTKITANVV